MADRVPSRPNSSRPTPNSKKVDDVDEDDDEGEAEEVPFAVEAPPDESFDEKYNKRMEFPLAIVSGILFHVLVAAGLVVLLYYFINSGPDRSGVQVKLVALTGLDESGEGSAGSGGVEDPAFRDDGDPPKGAESLLDPSKVPDIKENSPTVKFLDPTGNMPVSPHNAQAFDALNENLRKKLLGQRQGAGKEQGSGYDGSKGKGPGGTGSDSTLGRNMRWVLRFKVTNGSNYLDQLKELGAELMIPIPNSDKAILIADISRPSDRHTATDDDMRRLADKVQFADTRVEIVKSVARTLGLDFAPTSFWAFFPKKIEDELAKKETGYRNRRSEDIEETIFRVGLRDGVYEFVVDEQKVKH